MGKKRVKKQIKAFDYFREMPGMNSYQDVYQIIASETMLSVNTVRNFFQGDHTPQIYTLKQMVKFFGGRVSLESLMLQDFGEEVDFKGGR